VSPILSATRQCCHDVYETYIYCCVRCLYVWLHSYFVCNVCLFVIICSFCFLFLFATVKVNKVVHYYRRTCTRNTDESRVIRTLSAVTSHPAGATRARSRHVVAGGVIGTLAPLLTPDSVVASWTFYQHNSKQLWNSLPRDLEEE